MITSIKKLGFEEGYLEKYMSNWDEEKKKFVIENAKEIDFFLVRYTISNGKAVNCLVAQPVNIQGKLPCVVFFTGGYPCITQQQEIRKKWVLQSYFGSTLSKNFVTFFPRYSDEETSLDDLYGGEDLLACKEVQQVIDEWEHADKNRVAVSGISRGVTSAVFTIPGLKNVKAAVLLAGGYGGKKDFLWREKITPSMRASIPFDIDDDKEFEKKEDLITQNNLIPQNTKVLVMHGTNDKNTWIESARKFVKVLQERGVYVQYEESDADHYLTGKEDVRKTTSIVIDFLKKHL